MRPLLALPALLLALVAAPPARAHGTRSVTVEVNEVTPGRALVHVRAATPGDHVEVRVGSPCAIAAAGDEGDGALAITCPGALAGVTLGVDGLGPILSEAIVAVTLHDGARLSRVLTTDEPGFALPSRERGLGVARGYVGLGVRHILGGYDHLLFLLALVLLLRRPRAVLWAETAFTLSHSLSFSATALGLLRVSAPAAEAAIALSLALVALDVGAEGAAPTTRHGAGLAFVFGLVHGLGFAGGLAGIGLPDHDVAMALLGFAGGVEIGQLAFLAVALSALHLARGHVARLRVAPRAALLIGGVAAYWLIERTLACFAGRA